MPGDFGRSGPPDYGDDDRDGGGGSTLRLILIIVLAVVLVGGIGFGVWYFFLRDSGNNNSATGAQQNAPGPYEKVEELTSEIGWDVPGTDENLALSASWATDRTVVLATDTELTGFDRLDGTESWTVTPPKLEAWPENTENPAFCGASRTHRDGLVAVTYGWAKPAEKDEPFGGIADCVGLAVIDLDTGETVWAVDMLAEEEGPLVRDAAPHPEIAGDAVAVKLGGHFRAFGLSDGVERWQIEARSSDRDSCGVADLGSTDKAFVGLITCSLGDTALAAITLDPATGDELDRVDVSLQGIGVEPGVSTIVATEPAIVLHIAVTDEQDRYLVLTDTDTPPVKILEGEPGPDQLDMVRASSSGSFSQFRVMVTDELLVAATVGANDPSIGANKLVAHDLKTGEQVWQAQAPTGPDTMLFPIAVDGDGLLAIGSAWAEEQPPVGVFKVNLADGAISEFTGGYRAPGLNMSARGSSVRYHLGRLYVTTYIPVEGVARIYALH